MLSSYAFRLPSGKRWWNDVSSHQTSQVPYTQWTNSSSTRAERAGTGALFDQGTVQPTPCVGDVRQSDANHCRILEEVNRLEGLSTRPVAGRFEQAPIAVEGKQSESIESLTKALSTLTAQVTTLAEQSTASTANLSAQIAALNQRFNGMAANSTDGAQQQPRVRFQFQGPGLGEQRRPPLLLIICNSILFTVSDLKIRTDFLVHKN